MFLEIEIIPAVAAAILLLLNVVVTIGLIRDRGLTGKQKLIQFAVAWIVPLLGSLVVLSMQGTNHTRTEMKSLVPFPFYIVGYKDAGPNKNRDEYGSGDYPVEGSCGDGSCGGE